MGLERYRVHLLDGSAGSHLRHLRQAYPSYLDSSATSL